MTPDTVLFHSFRSQVPSRFADHVPRWSGSRVLSRVEMASLADVSFAKEFDRVGSKGKKIHLVQLIMDALGGTKLRRYFA